MDFTENYAPVIHDVSYRVLLVIMIVWGLMGKIVDIETAFLHGDLKETIYMDCPEGLAEATGEEVTDEDCVELLQAIYGLVQAARQWWEKLMDILRKIGFVG